MRTLWICIVLLTFSLKGQKQNLLPDTIALCSGDTASIEVRKDVEERTIQWQTPVGRVLALRRIKAYAQGKYYLKAQAQGSSFVQSDSVFVKLLHRPAVHFHDTALCAGQRITLDAQNPGMRYLWSTGDHSRKIQISRGGNYWVRVMNGKCVATDTLKVLERAGANMLAQSEMTFCLDNAERTISIDASADTRIQWSTGDTVRAIFPVREGYYFVTTRHPLCGVHTDSVRVKLKACECEILIPNSFTPNEDGKNDYFFPVLTCDYNYYNILITDRWGNTVFSSNNPLVKWDGRYKGNFCPEDIYMYRIESAEKTGDRKQVRTGNISLFR